MVVIALSTIRRRPVGNGLILAGVAVAATGSAVAGLGAAPTAVFIAAAVVLLYAGFIDLRLPVLGPRGASSPTR